MERIICILIGYLLGSFLTAEVVVRRAIGKRPEQIGSGNPGMANVMSEVGRKEGFLVLAGDVGKTMLACLLSYLLFYGSLGRICMLYAGIGAILGHNYPAWNHFHGGKGVAVTCTFCILFSPIWGLLACISGALVVILTGYLPIGGILIPLLYLIFMCMTASYEVGILALLSLLFMLAKHYKEAVKVWHGQGKQVLRLIGRRK